MMHWYAWEVCAVVTRRNGRVLDVQFDTGQPSGDRRFRFRNDWTCAGEDWWCVQGSGFSMQDVEDAREQLGLHDKVHTIGSATITCFFVEDEDALLAMKMALYSK